jgi:hypothetical protein
MPSHEMMSPSGRPTFAAGLFLLMVMIIPIFGLIDLVESVRGGLGAAYLEESRSGGERASMNLLYLREVLLAAVTLIMCLWLLLRARLLPRLPASGPCVLFVLISACMSVTFYPPIVVLSGLRQFAYFTLLYVLYFLRVEIERVEQWFVYGLVVVAVCEFIAAIVETVIFPTGGATALFGNRVYGTFNNPNTLGVVFAAITFGVLFLGRQSALTTYGVVGMAIVGELLSGSRAGILALSFVLTAFAMYRLRTVESRGMCAMLAVGLTIVLYYSVGALAGRDIPTPLEDPRLEVFADEMQGKSVLQLAIGRGLGVGTNTLYVLGQGRPDTVRLTRILDSTYTALIVQIGFIGFGLLLLAFGSLSRLCGFPGWVLFGLMLVVGINGNVLEYYPFNLMLTATYGILWGRQNGRKQSSRVWVAR